MPHKDPEARRANGRERTALYLKRQYVRGADPRLQQRRRELKRKFGITLEDYNAMLVAQGAVCAICKRPETRLHRRSPDPSRHQVRPLAVDHCHKTGVVRGLLCDDCNVAIGRFNDDSERLCSAIKYLERGRLS